MTKEEIINHIIDRFKQCKINVEWYESELGTYDFMRKSGKSNVELRKEIKKYEILADEYADLLIEIGVEPREFEIYRAFGPFRKDK